jgi:hypothetical protein
VYGRDTVRVLDLEVVYGKTEREHGAGNRVPPHLILKLYVNCLAGIDLDLFAGVFPEIKDSHGASFLSLPKLY